MGAIINHLGMALVGTGKRHGVLEGIGFMHLHIDAHRLEEPDGEDINLLLLSDALASRQELEELFLVVVD